MKTLGFIVRLLFSLVGVVALSAIATFFISIFNLEGVENSLNFFKNLF